MLEDASKREPRNPSTPCVGICRIGDDGLCAGCGRTLEEIARWGTLSEEERQRWMREEQPRRRRPRG